VKAIYFRQPLQHAFITAVMREFMMVLTTTTKSAAAPKIKNGAIGVI
jgi:hypothetical protein